MKTNSSSRNPFFSHFSHVKIKQCRSDESELINTTTRRHQFVSRLGGKYSCCGPDSSEKRTSATGTSFDRTSQLQLLHQVSSSFSSLVAKFKLQTIKEPTTSFLRNEDFHWPTETSISYDSYDKCSMGEEFREDSRSLNP